MTNQKPEPDLSKQQILESIGRIVAEGESRGQDPDGDAPPSVAPAPAEQDAKDDDDILDLVDAVDEQGNVIPLERARPGAAAASAPPFTDRKAPGAAAGGRASEEQVLEALRPMLQTWLNTNMPPMVERLVKREIERASTRSEPE